jgi:RHS repeat-associated protein
VTTNYFYSGPQTIEEDQGGNPTVQYVYGVNANTPICRIAPSGSGTQVLYYTSDANNNVTALVDGATGDVVERYVYTAYGQTTVYSPGWVSTESSASTYGNEITYASYRFNPDSGLFYVNARYYDPALGTWAQRDPAGYIDGMSLYPYVQSNPTTYTDPTGLCTIAPPRTPVGTQRK